MFEYNGEVSLPEEMSQNIRDSSDWGVDDGDVVSADGDQDLCEAVLPVAIEATRLGRR